MSSDPLRLLALWALIHETADEGWKAAVARGQASGGAGAGDFGDALAAVVAEEKEKLKALLASGGCDADGDGEERRGLEELRFEMGQMRARLESMEASLDALRRLMEERASGHDRR